MSGLEELSREELIALARALAGRVSALEKENGELRERVAVGAVDLAQQRELGDVVVRG
ncbi:hypothetical protein ACFPOI_33665 [Nonomuraea angiospora]|uniref:Uncharacterized protein n=1 Tax=Nonomuraea angiospora TaxID=46172 RepID=A0ABR9LT03_9ACTN|nr:hypothetical protein [Nonomuraea angiospora]MBE1583788.1 hypothetical protein [Nonomuraea angiospora]